MSRREHLLGALADHIPFDETETTAVARIRRLLDGADPWSRASYDPGHITGSAFVLRPDGGAVALILHQKIGRWLQPGGHVEPGDATVEATAVREVGEEIGVAPDGPVRLLDVDVHTFPQRHDQPEHLHFDVRWAFRADSTSIEAGDGAGDARWFAFEECLGMEASIARPVRKLLATAPPTPGAST